MPDLLPRRPLYEGGPEVSRFCLGTMIMGEQTPEADAARLLDRFMDAGGNFIDTADTYVDGESERIVGRLLQGRREEVVLATKLGNPVGGASGGLAPDYMRSALAASLDRLQTDSINLYYLHLDDNVTPLEEVIATLGAFIDEGRIRAWGFSNFRPWKIAEMIRIADAQSVPRPVAAQPYYHMLNRVAESDLLPACLHFRIAVVPYSPLARGVLTGKYSDGTPSDSRAARGDKRLLETDFQPETIAAAGAAADHARASGRAPAALALQWVLANRAIASVLIGPRNMEQLETYLAAAFVSYTSDDEAALSALCPSGMTPAPGFTDPRYPLRGRETGFSS